MAALGESMKSTFHPALVAASYCASCCGCLLTIELLHRRGTALGSLRSWLESLGCAICMGLVGIWCMHFIGNRAIILGDANPEEQLVYNAGYTILSVFLPVFGLVIAFSAAELSSSSKSRFMRCLSLTTTGVFAGLAIVGMHYVGNFGITNYKLSYAHRYLAASIIIAIGDCLIVLVLFYTLREKWISSWWKRSACALFLAGGVSAMHFSASTGCEYRRLRINNKSAMRSRNIQVAVAGALCAVALAALIGLIIFSRHRKRFLKTRSQKVMLACAMFDPNGRILVTTEGVLPTREITDKYQHRTFNEDFNTAHPAFHWIFRVSRNWLGVSELLPKMKSHLQSARKSRSTLPSRPVSSSASSAEYDPETYDDYSIIFRERFCTAAASLANAMHLPVERIGVLYDQIIETGTLKPEDRAGKRNAAQFDKLGEAESGSSDLSWLFGKGQLLFLTRQLSAEDADRLLNAGYKFGSVQQVGRSIAEPMQVPLLALEGYLAEIKRFVNRQDTLDKPGTWLSFFGLIPRPNSKGFDVAVKKHDQEELPDVQLLPIEPQQWQMEFLQRMDGMKTRACMYFLDERNQADVHRSDQERQFSQTVRQAMLALGQQVPADWFREARLLAKPVFAHYSHHYRSPELLTWIYALCVITDMHTSMEACNSISRIPLTFFSTRQRCYKGSPDHSILAREIHQEFAPLLARKTTLTHKRRASATTRLGPITKRLTSRVGLHSSGKRPIVASRRNSMDRISDDGSSVHELIEYPDKIADTLRDTGAGAGAERNDAWGGILVNRETMIKSDSKSDCSQDSRPGIRVAISTTKQEDTFVDELMEATRTRFVPPKIGH